MVGPLQAADGPGAATIGALHLTVSALELLLKNKILAHLR